MTRLGRLRELRDARGHVAAVARARWRLRAVDQLGPMVRLWGGVRVVNHGRLIIGERVRLIGHIAPIELVSGPGATLDIGERTFINVGVSVAATERITIGASCQLGPHCMIMDNSYHHIEPERRNEVPPSVPVSIGDNVWLGARVIVLPGTTIGDGSVIGAGSVVNGNIPARSLAAGLPAKVIRSI